MSPCEKSVLSRRAFRVLVLSEAQYTSHFLTLLALKSKKMSSNSSNPDGFHPQPDLPTIDTSFLDSTRLSESGPIGEEPQPQPNSVINRDQIRFLFDESTARGGTFRDGRCR